MAARYTARRSLKASPRQSCPQEDILGTVNLCRQRIGAALIRMNFKHQAMMCLLDLPGAGAGLETENGESLLGCHRARAGMSGTFGPSGSLGGLAPIRHETIEVALDKADRGRILRAQLAPKRDHRAVVELLQAPALETAVAHGAGHRAGVVSEAHAEVARLDVRDLAPRTAAGDARL